MRSKKHDFCRCLFENRYRINTLIFDFFRKKKSKKNFAVFFLFAKKSQKRRFCTHLPILFPRYHRSHFRPKMTLFWPLFFTIFLIFLQNFIFTKIYFFFHQQNNFSMKFFFLFSMKFFIFMKFFFIFHKIFFFSKLFSKFCRNFVEKKYFLVDLSWLQWKLFSIKNWAQEIFFMQLQQLSTWTDCPASLPEASHCKI